MNHRGLRIFIVISSSICVVLTWITIVFAAQASTVNPDTFSSKDIIMILFGLLQTVFMGIGVWLITNDKELFIRMSAVESKVNVRDSLCDERHDTDVADHTHRRASDVDVNLVLVQSIETLQKLIKVSNVDQK